MAEPKKEFISLIKRQTDYSEEIIFYVNVLNGEMERKAGTCEI